MGQPTLSVIIPVYNAVKYLEKSVKSVQSQTLKNIEIILVDDGSRDGSSELCDRLAADDERIRVIHQKNSGASAARNTGIEAAQGIYITFVDADDSIDSDIYSKCCRLLQETQADCVKFGVREEYYDQEDTLIHTRKCSCEDGIYEGRKAISSIVCILEQKPLFGYTCNIIYKKDYIVENRVHFNPKLKVNEDFDFNLSYFKHVDKLVCVHDCAYHYAKRNQNSLSSQSGNYSYANHMLKIKGLLQMLEESDNCTEENLRSVFWLYTRFVYASLAQGESFGVIHKDGLFLRFREVNFSNCSLKQRVMTQVLKTGNSVLILTFAKSMKFLKTHLPVIFVMLKR